MNTMFLLSVLFVLNSEKNPAPDVRCLREDYGAVCDGVADDSAALNQALIDAVNCTNPDGFELQLPADATIKLNTAYGIRHVCSVSGLRNFYLTGNNATFMIGRGADGSLTGKGLFNFAGITNSVFRNFKIDYEEAPWSQGEVIHVDTVNQRIILRNDSGYMTANDPRFFSDEVTTWMTLHGDDGLLAYSGVLYGSEERVLSDGTVELKYRKWPASIDTNRCTRYVRVLRAGGGNVFRTIAADHVILDGIRIYTAPSLGIQFLSAKSGNQVLHCRIEPRAGSGRMISATAGGISFFGGAVTGPLIQSNTVIKAQDDAIQVHSEGAYIYEASTNRVKLQRRNNLQWDTGDFVGLYNYDNNTFFSSAQIVTISAGTYPADDPLYPAKRYWQLELDREIPSDFLIEPVHSYYDTTRLPTVAFNRNKNNSGAAILDNLVEYTRARGLLLDGSDFTVERNTIRFTTMPGIFIGGHIRYGSPDGWLTSFAENFHVEENTLEFNQNYGGVPPEVDGAAILCGNSDHLTRSFALNSQFNRNVVMTGNSISSCGYSAVRFHNTMNGSTYSNIFDRLNRHATGDTYAIQYGNCTEMQNVHVDNLITNSVLTQEVKAW